MPYVGEISKSPVATAMARAGRAALDRAMPDPNALARAYDYANADISVVRAQAEAWQFAPFTTLLGEAYERRLMLAYGRISAYRNKWLALDEFFEQLNITYTAQLRGRDADGNESWYDVDRAAGTWAGYDSAKAVALRCIITLPPQLGLDAFNSDFQASEGAPTLYGVWYGVQPIEFIRTVRVLDVDMDTSTPDNEWAAFYVSGVDSTYILVGGGNYSQLAPSLNYTIDIDGVSTNLGVATYGFYLPHKHAVQLEFNGDLLHLGPSTNDLTTGNVMRLTTSRTPTILGHQLLLAKSATQLEYSSVIDANRYIAGQIPLGLALIYTADAIGRNDLPDLAASSRVNIVNVERLTNVRGIEGNDGYRVTYQHLGGPVFDEQSDLKRQVALYRFAPSSLRASENEFIAYLREAVSWLMPYFGGNVEIAVIADSSTAQTGAHPGVATLGVTYLEGQQT